MPFSALVVGSMAPDFLYFALLTDYAHFGHTLRGLFLFCLPVGFAALYAFHRFLKRPLLAASPASLRLRVPADHPFSFGPLSHFFWIASAILLGSITHIFWDGCTHLNGLVVKHWPALRHPTIYWPHQPVYVLLQNASSIVGLLILAVAYSRWVKRTPVSRAESIPPLPLRSRTILFVVGSAIAAIFGVLFGYYSAQRFPQIWLEVFAVRAVIGAMAMGLLEMFIFCAWWHLRKHNPPEVRKSSRAEIQTDSAD
jgi:uncharacterized membrane protein YbhN (UPF0104 family)